jgi:hypothetical protein
LVLDESDLLPYGLPVDSIATLAIRKSPETIVQRKPATGSPAIARHGPTTGKPIVDTGRTIRRPAIRTPAETANRVVIIEFTGIITGGTTIDSMAATPVGNGNVAVTVRMDMHAGIAPILIVTMGPGILNAIPGAAM